MEPNLFAFITKQLAFPMRSQINHGPTISRELTMVKPGQAVAHCQWISLAGTVQSHCSIYWLLALQHLPGGEQGPT